MTVQLNHTIVPSKDKREASTFLARVLGLSAPAPVGHFMAVELANGVTLDYDDRDEFSSLHFAFLVDEDEFDRIFERLRREGIAYYADPGHRRVAELRVGRGRGMYFADPDGHNLEVMTAPVP